MPEEFSIGDDAVVLGEGDTWFKFDAGIGDIPTPQRRVQRLERDGVDFVRYRDSGLGSQPFSVTTTRFVADYAAAKALIDKYVSLVGGTVQDFRWRNIEYAPYSVKVLSVQATKLADIGCVVGSFDDTANKGMNVATWQLEFRDNAF